MKQRKTQILADSIRAMLKKRHSRSVQLRVSALLALIIAGVTVFNLVLPAITLTSDSDSEIIRQIELSSSEQAPPEEGEPAETDGSTEDSGETREEGDVILFPEEETEVIEEPVCPPQLLTAQTDSFLLYADAGEGALPENSMIIPCAVPWDLPCDLSGIAVGRILNVRAVSVAFCDAEGSVIEPMAPVKLYLRPLFLSGVGIPAAFRLDDSGLTPVAGAELSEAGDFVLWADPSAIYAVAETVPCAHAAAEACAVTAFCGRDTGLPGNTQLAVREILPGDPEYAGYLADSAGALGMEDPGPARFITVAFYADGQWIEPWGDVSLELRLAGSAFAEYRVVRLAGDASRPAEWVGIADAVPGAEDSGEVVLSFTTGGASAFGVFTQPEPAAEVPDEESEPAAEDPDGESEPAADDPDDESEPAAENPDDENEPAAEDPDDESEPAAEDPDDESEPAADDPDGESEPADDPDGESEPAEDPDGGTGLEESAYPAQQFTGLSGSIRVSVDAPEGAFPAGTSMTVYAIASDEILDAVSEAVDGRIVGIQAVDILFFGPDGLEIEPLIPVRVSLGSAGIAEADTSLVVHVDQAGEAVVVEQAAPEALDGAPAEDEVIFEAGGFSVYVLVYTVDFVYEIDGREYAFSIPGGGFVTLRRLAELLGINETVNVTDLEQFLADVEHVEFSDPALVWAGKAEEDCTVGGLRAAYGLDSACSAELTEAEIEAIDGAAVSAGEWLLISRKPFSGTETLTVTMTDGEVWTVRVTDAQISTNVLTADGKTFVITVTYGDDAELPEGTKLIAAEILPESEEYIQYLGRTWAEVNREYLEQMERLRLPGLDDVETVRPVNIDAARFFDLTFLYEGAELEPRAPVQVDIRLAEGLSSDAAEPVVGVVHFPAMAARGAKGPGAENGSYTRTELITAFETEKNAEGGVVGFTYEQESFSVVGAYVGQKTYDVGYSPMDPAITLPKLMATRAGGSAAPLEPLEASKTLTPDEVNGQRDDTYTLALSVKGDEEYFEQTTKANVLIVMDRSSSMDKGVEGAAVPFDGTPQSGKTYYGIINGELLALNYSTAFGTTTWTHTDMGGTTTTYTGTVYESSSRFQAERAALDELLTALTSKNVTDPSDPEYAEKHDVIEVKITGFASTSNRSGGDLPASTESVWATDKATLMATVNDNTMNNGTNWEDALIYARETADAMKQAQPNEDVYIIFLTDGEPTAVYGERAVNGYGAHHYDSTNTDGTVDLIHDLHNGTVYHNNSDGQGGFIYAFNYARDGHPGAGYPSPAQAIVNAGHKFYGIFTFNPGAAQTGYLERLVNYAYGLGDVETQTPTLDAYYTNAADIAQLRESFDNIFTTIFDSLAYGNVKIVDGLTVDAMTTALVDGAADGLRYKVTDSNGNVVYSVTAANDSSDPTVTFHFYGNDYSYTPGTTNSPVRKVTTYTYTGTDPLDPDGSVTTTYIKTEGGPETTVEKRVTRSVPTTENGVTIHKTVSTTTTASSLAELNADTNAQDSKTYYSLSIGGLEYRMALAKTVTTGTGDDTERKLTWDLSPIGSLAKGYTYTAEFTVWPNQDAFDYVAGLNNGLAGFTWDDTIAEAVPPAPDEPQYYKGGVAEYPSIVYLYPNGPYSVLTNTMQEVQYTVVHAQGSGDVMTTTEEPHTESLDTPAPMDLTDTRISVTKEWNDTLDPAPLRKLIEDAGFNASGQPNFHITMRVKRFTPLPLPDGSWVEYTSFDFYPRKVVTNAQTGDYTYVWDPQELDIAPGIMVTTHPGGVKPYSTAVLDGVTYYILETGHDYQINEDALENNYNFEFQSVPYHPMLVDGVMKNVSLTEDSEHPGHYLAEEVVDANTTSNGQSMTTAFIFRGTNNLRSGMNIIKKVQDKTGADIQDDTPFYVRLYAQDKDGNPLTYSPPLQGSMTDEEYQQALKDYDDAYPIWYKTFSGYTLSEQGNYQGVRDPEVYGDGWSYSWPSGEVKEIRTGRLLQIINIPYGTRIKVVEVDPVYDNSDPPQIIGFVDIDVGDYNNVDYRLQHLAGDIVDNASPDGYTSIGFDTSYEIIITNRHTKRIGDIIAEKKWYKTDGTEYTSEELATLGANTAVTGELWRSHTVLSGGTGPTVTLMATYNNGAGGPVQLWSGQVLSGSDLQFSVAISATSNPTVSASSGATVPRQSGVPVGQYEGSNVYKETANAFTLSGITEDVTIMAAFSQDDSNIGYKILQRTPPTTSSTTVSEQVGSAFTLSAANGWRRVWTPTELAEAEDVEYTYEFRNVAESNLPSGYSFDSTPTVSFDGSGNMTCTFANLQERKTELVVRKVWAGGGTPAGAVTYKLQRTGYAADGTVAEATADYGSGTFTLSASTMDNGNAWQYRHTDLPADNNKRPEAAGYIRYEYSVVETPVPGGYTATYYDVVENGETVRVIRNTPDANNSVQVQKLWQDGAGNLLTSGIPEGACITGTLVRDYVGPRTVTVTVHRSATEWNNANPYTYGDVSSGDTEEWPKVWQIPEGAVLSIWTRNSNGEAPSSVRIDGQSSNISASGATNSEYPNLGQAYVITVNADTSITINYGYYGHGSRLVYSTAGGDTNGDSGTEDIGTFTLNAENGWTWSWTSLNEDPIRTYTYRLTNVQEHTANGSVVSHYDGFNLPTVGALTQGANNSWSGSITNVKLNSVQIVKIDEATRNSANQKRLPGAMFRLLRYDGTTYAAYADNGYGAENGIAVGADGTLLFANLPDGVYKIVEVRPPDGYIKAINNDIYFDILNGSVQRYDRAYGEDGRTAIAPGSVVAAVSQELTDGETAFVVGNTSGSILPSTGGAGTALYPVIGGLLALCSAGMLLLRRRRRA